MDRSRRELYVEGNHDRIFLNWLVGDEKNPDALVVDIRSVELPSSTVGGEKGRLIDFAKEVEGADAQIKVFADADTDRVLGRSVPSNVWLTDQRDLEGYVLRRECIEKVINLGFLNDKLDADEVLRQVALLGRKLGIFRLMSELDERDLPFKRTQVKRYIVLESNTIKLDLERYASALLQNAGISLKGVVEVINRHSETEDEYSHLDDKEIVHGKDAIMVLGYFLRTQGLQSQEVEWLLRCLYEKQWLDESPALERTYRFLTT